MVQKWIVQRNSPIQFWRFLEVIGSGSLSTTSPRQGRLNSIIGPRAKQFKGAPAYTTNHRNENVNVDKIKHIFSVLVLPT
jgi:hypothetical protein